MWGMLRQEAQGAAAASGDSCDGGSDGSSDGGSDGGWSVQTCCRGNVSCESGHCCPSVWVSGRRCSKGEEPRVGDEVQRPGLVCHAAACLSQLASAKWAAWACVEL